MSLRENPTDDDWYQVWKGHPTALPGFNQRESSRVYTRLGLNPQVARWAGRRSFVSIVNKAVPFELQRRIRGDGGLRNAGLVREWRQCEEAEPVVSAARSNAEALRSHRRAGGPFGGSL